MMRNSIARWAGFVPLVCAGGFAAIALAAPPKHSDQPTRKSALQVARIELTDAPKLKNIVRGKAGSVVLLNIWAST